MTEKAKKVIKKVASKLTKASQAHAGQAKALKAIELRKGGRPKKKKSKSRVNEAGNYTKPEMRKRLFNRIKAGSKGGKPGQWSARKAQMLAAAYKKEYKKQKERGEHPDRMERQRARRAYDKKGISRKGKDVSHNKMLSKGGSNKDGTRLESPSKIRARNGQKKKKK